MTAREVLRRGQAVGRAFDGGAFDLLFEAGDADFEELVQVGAEDAEELDALEQGRGRVQRLLQDALIELQPAQLAVEEVFRRHLGAWPDIKGAV